MKRKVIIEIIAALLITLYLYAAVSKWIEMTTFEKAMYNQPFPHWFATFIIWTIPPVEVVISLMLMFKRSQLTGFYASLILMSMFTLYIGAIMLHFFPRVPCSCGGVIKMLKWPQHLIFNLFFVGICVWAILLERNKPFKMKGINQLSVTTT